MSTEQIWTPQDRVALEVLRTECEMVTPGTEAGARAAFILKLIRSFEDGEAQIRALSSQLDASRRAIAEQALGSREGLRPG